MTDDGPGATGSVPAGAISDAPTLIDQRFEVLSMLGEGAMGTVYKVRNKRVGALFAMKVLRTPLNELPLQAKRKSEALLRFDREVKILGRLRSDHIVKVTDCGACENGSPYLIMELLEGRTLARELDTGAFTLARAVDVCIQICRGLVKAHEANIVHRDLKPANIFLTRGETGNDVVKILDFGVAKLLDGEEQVHVTQTDTAVGTPLYMSPEQVSGARDVDARADLYAVGAILFEMLAGRPPHCGDSPRAVMAAILTEDPEPLESLRPDLPSGLVKLVHTALSKKREERPPSALHLERSLSTFSSSRVDFVRPRAHPPALTLDEDPGDSTSSIVGAPRRPEGSEATTLARWRVAGATALLLISAVSAWVIGSRRRALEAESTPPQPTAAIEQGDAKEDPVALPPPASSAGVVPARALTVAPVAASVPEATQRDTPKRKGESPRLKQAPSTLRARVPLRPLQVSSPRKE